MEAFSAVTAIMKIRFELSLNMLRAMDGAPVPAALTEMHTGEGNILAQCIVLLVPWGERNEVHTII